MKTKIIRFIDYTNGGDMYYSYQPQSEQDEEIFFEDLLKTTNFLSLYYDVVDTTEMILNICNLKLVNFKKIDLKEDIFIYIDDKDDIF